MKMRDILIICLIMCFICSISAVSAVDLDTNGADKDILATQDNVSVVSESNDLSSYSLPDTETVLGDGDAGSFTDLKNLIDNDETGIVTLDKNYTYNDATDADLVSLGISVSADKTIQGNGQNIVIDGKGVSRIFQLSGTITLQNLTFVNGFNSMTAPIYSSGTLTVSGCSFINNTGLNGGALQSAGSLTMESCTFINNTAVNGGAIQTGSSPFAVTSISNSKFINNSANTGGSLHTNGVQTTLTNIEIINGTADMDGGAIYLGHRDLGGRPVPTNVRLTNITIRNSNATNNGGAIMVRGLITSMNNITISDCNATNGGAIYLGAVSRTMDNLTLINNTATNDGGAIYFWPDDTASSANGLTNSNLTNNTAGGNGGAVYAYGNTGKIRTTAFTDNNATNGGAIYIHGNSWTVANCNFTNNSASDSVIAGGNGGAIMWDGHNGIIDNNAFTSNNATNRGGAIFVENCDNVTITNSGFDNNFANVNGGAVEFYRYALNGNVINSTFNNNIANRSGGAVFWYGDTGKIINVNFTGNKALGNVMAPSSYGDDTTGGDGGAIMWTGLNGIVNNCTFTDNYASQRGGGVYLQGSVEGNCTNTSFISCDFISNEAGLNGGAIDWHEGAHDGLVTMSNFKDNVAASNGGAIFWSGHNGRILHSNFTNNSANGLIVDIHGNFGDGGAIIWSGINGTVDDCRFIDNNASQRGGGVFLQNCTHGNCTNTTFSHVYFENNFAGVNGGAIDWHKGTQNGQVSYGVFVNNTANRSGGAIFWFGTDGEILHSNFTGNKALGNVLYNNSFGIMTYGGHGGAVMWTGSNGTIDNCTFDENKAKVNGGAIFMQGSTEGNCSNIHISNVKFGNNFAGVNGGAVDWYKGAYNCTLENATFTNNVANRSGGAVFWFGRLGSIKNAIFTNNSALGNVMYENSFGVNTTGGHGGAIMWTGADGTIDNCTFISNKAKVNGGAVFMQGSTEGNCSNLHISNVICEDNFAGVNGGAIDWYKGAHDCTLENATFNNNVANRSGGAVFWYGEHGYIKNASFTNNQALGLVNASSSYGYNTTGGDGGAVMWTGSNGLIEGCNFTQNYAAARGGAVFLQGSVEGNCTNVTISNSNFEQNKAETNGGAVNFFRGAVNGRILNSSFKSNEALTGIGGAVVWRGYNGTIDGATFDDNTAYAADAGAVYIEGDSAKLLNTEFNRNLAGDDGGALYWTGNYGKIYNLTANDNKGISYGTSHSKGGTIIVTGSNMTIDTVEVRNGYAEVEGGGLFLTGNNVNITNVQFYDCTVNDGSVDNIGGALDIIGNNTRLINATIEGSDARYGGAIDWAGDDGYACNITVNNNRASEDGAALRIVGDRFEIENSIFNDNEAGDDGGAIYWSGDDGIARNLTFNNNRGISSGDSSSNGGTMAIIGSNILIEDSSFKKSVADIAGGAIFVTGNNVNITGSSFEECSVSMDKVITGRDYTTGGGAIYVLGNETHIMNCTFDNTYGREGGVIYVQGNNAVIDNATTSNSHALNGGAFYIAGVNAIVSNSAISLSHVTGAGGAIYINGQHASVLNTTVDDTYAKKASDYDDTNLGGAIYINGNYANILGSEFENSGAYQGGALYLEGNYCNLTNSSIKDGYAYADGGALYSTGSYSNIYYSNFTSNEARGDGGAMYWFGGKNSVKNTIVGCIFLENVAYANSNSNTKGGGAIYWSEGGYYGTIKDSQFINNSVQSSTKADGGAILWDKCHFAVIDNCIFDGDYIETTNTGDVWVQGGAIYLRVDDPYTISNSKFVNCYSEKEAGALYIQSNTNGRKILIVNTTFENNVAQAIGQNSYGGGAVQVKQCDFAVFQNVTFRNNTANQGGAVTILETRTTIQFTNCTFDNNNATNGNGGSIWANRLFYIYNTTIANSTASDYGGGLYTTADITYNNLTFINNTATYGGGLYWNKANIKIQNMKFINNTAFERGGAIYITTTATVQNVTMTGNKAFTGSAIWANKDLTLIDVYVMENQANSSSLDISFDESSGKIVVLFKGKDKYLNAIYLDGGCILYCTNVTYWDETGEINSGETRIRIPTTTSQDTPEGGQNLTVRVYGGNGVLLEQYLLTDNNGKVYLDLADILPGEDYHEMYVEAELNDDTYYTIIKSTTRSPSQVNASANKTTYHSNSTIDVNVTQGATGNVSVYLGDVFLANITLNNSKGSINISTLVEGAYLPAGNHTLAMVYNGNVKYDKSNTTAILEITKITPVLLLNVTGIGYNLLVNVTVMDGEYNISDATGNVTIQVEDRTATIYLGNGQGMTIIYGLPIGNYTVNATYHGDNNYYSITNSTEANVTEKTQTVLVLDVDSEKLYYINETVPIKVIILPNGEGNVTLYINGIPHELTLQTVGDSTFVEFNATELKDGINYVFATYEGTEIFAPSWAQDTFRVTKYNSIIGIETANITFKDTESINITLPDDAEGIIKVLINDTPYLVELVGGSAQVNVSDLAVGTYNVTVIFNGDKKYYNSTNSTLFNVTKIKPVVTIDVDNVTYGNETTITVTLPDGVTGNVTVKINDTYYVFDTQNLTDSKVILPGVILPAGNYTVEATYNGDANYSVSANSTNFTVYKATPVINVTVEDIYYGEVANITVTVGLGVTGTIVIKVNGSESEPLTISEGKVNLTVSGLAVGNYPIEVIYSGNDNFTDRTITDDFNVFQIGTVLDVDVHDITIWDKEYINITIRNATGAVITNATGNVTININGVNHTAEIKDGIARFNTSDLTIGHKVVWVFYDGDRNLTGNKSMEEFDVSPRTPVINITAQNITVGQLGNITVKAPLNATGFVVIEVIGDDTYFRFISNGQATVYPKDLKVGNYTVKATYYGGGLDNYTVTAAEDVNFTVSKLNATVDIDVKDINYTETAVITVTVPDGVSGNITIKLNDTAGTTETKTIVDGKAIFEIDNLAAGNYTVNVTYNGNDDYNINNTEHDEFEVKKIDPTLQIYPPSATAGEKAVITIFINDRIDGEYVTITGLDKEYTKEIMNGVVSFTTDGPLDYDSYTMTVTYAGNQNFTDSTKSVTFTPAKISDYEITVIGTNITVNDDEIITVTVPTGVTNVSIWVNGTKYTNDSFVNGEAKFNITGLKEGVYTVNATVNDVNYTTKVANNIFTVSKTYPSIDITVINDTSIYVGDTVKVIVTVPSDVTENVTIEINGRNFTNATVNGNATFYIPDITYGDKTVVATYVGDDKYRFNSTTANFTVNKRTPTIVVTTDGPIDVGDNITISVDVPANATGYVVVNVNGTNYTINITNGDYSVVVPGLGNGTWNVTATYIGDDQYLPNTNKTSFVVNKVDSTIAIDVESIDYGNKVNITVTVKDDATGYITIRINETRNITLPIDGGKVNWIVDNLAADNYTVYANYSGDDKYNENKTNKTFEVRQISPEIEIIRVISTADENATIIVKVDPRVTENVTVTVGGKPYSKAVDENGVAVITTDVLDYGTYTVTASYAGDKNFTIDSDTYEFTTNKTSDYSINITATDIKVGNNTNITVRVPADATGNVIIELNGTNYTAIINEDGIAVLNNISTLKEGVYNVTAYFGNDKYVNKTVSTRFVVSKVDAPIKVDVENLYVGDTAYINVTVPDDDTGSVTIEINGKVYGPESVTDGVARFAVPDVTYGNKTVAVTYSGTDKYVANFTTANFTVDKCTPVVNVTNITIIDGKDAVINITGPSDRDANLIVTVDGVDYAVNMTNGNATLTVKGLSVDNYTVTVSYIENDKYVKATASGWVNVTAKGTSAIIIGVDEIYKVGDDIVITLTPVNSTGDVRVTINGKEYRINEGTVTITNGLPNGTYVIEAVLDEDDNYYGSSANATFRVVKNNITISISDITGDIVVDSPVTFTAELNESVTGDVIFTINGANYTVHVSDSNVATYEYTPVNNDTITVVATFMGNDKYNANVSAQKQFNVSKIATDINVTVKTPVTYGDDAVITVELNATLNTTAKLLVDGKEYDVALINGKGVFNASGLNSGDHEVNVTYVGDDKYAGSKDSTRFTVDNATLVPEVTAFNVTVEENTTFVINVTDDFNGNVSITVGDKLLYNGTVKTLINADKLPAGDKTATVVFYGDNNYDELTLDNVLFTVSRVTPTIEVTIDDVTYPDKAIAVINVGNAANGTVNVTVDGKVFNGTVTNGVANVDLTGLSAGSKVVDVEFFAGDDYNDNTTATAKFTVNKANSTIIIDVEKVYIYNDTIIINLTAKGSNGTVNVTINGKVYPINDEMQVLIENITAGEYTIIANLASDENCTAATNSTTFKVKQAGTNVTIDVESIYKVGDDIVITLSTVNSTDLAVTINGEVYTVTEDNTIVITGGLEAGDYIINAILSGNENYTGFNDTKSFTVVKNNITISVADVPGDIVVDTPVTFTANLNESVTGDVIFTINGANYTVHVSDSNVATYEYTPINNDTITVVATFTGNDKYNSNVSDSKAFNVNRLNSTITVKVDNITVGDVAAVNITVITGATGNVTITIGDEYNKTVGVTDGVISVIVPGLTVGDKTVNVTYNGNDKYLPSSNSTDFTVGQTSAGMNIVVENITYGEIETIIVFVNATGNVTIKLDGNEIETVNITDGKVEYPISGLDAGNYTVEVIYNGDANTNATSLKANFTVEKADPVISIEAEDITYGDVEYIIVHVNAEGNVTIKVNGKTVEEITLNNGNHVLKASRWDVPNYDGKATVEAYNLEAGKYPVEVTYNGNNNYNKATATASFNVIKDNTTVDVQIESSISVGETQVMNITIDNENATGNVTIIIDGKNYTANVTNGVANFTIPELPAGNHSVVVIYEGDKNLTGNWTSATFEVTKLTPEITVNATDITVGDKTLIEVTAPSDVTRPVLVDVDGVGYYVNITDGKCSIEVPISKEGTYNVTARYLGDDRYTEDRANNTFKASKVENPSINATVENITYGDSAVIKVSVPEDATGNVTITVNGTDYVVPVANGTATAVVPGLEPRNYTIDVVYNGDDKYGPSNTTAELTVSKTTTDDIEVIDQGNGTVVVVVGDNATGNVTVKVGNNTYTAEVINGTAVVTLDNETPGTHEIEVIYSGDDTHEGANTTSTVTIPKVETPISVEASDIKVGETSEVVVNVPDDAKGNVTIEIDGVKYTEEIKDGKAVFNIENLTAGNKTVYVDYVGDNNYTGNHTSAKFTVSKVTPEITLNVTADGDDLIIDVTAPEDATNPVLVDVNGVGYYVNVTDGKGQLVLPDVEGGKYDVTAKYPGDDKYYASDDVSKSVEVSDLPSFVTAEVADITYGEDAVIEISVPDDATGNVTVTIDNKTYTANVSGGKAVVTVPGLKAGNYSVDVSYSGDDKYMPSSNTTDLEVSKAEIDPADIKVIDQGNGTVVVVVPDNATGNVTIKVGNDTYTAEVINGTAVVTLENATPGTHEIEVIYSGDDNHEGANTTSEATIPKYPSEVSVDAPEITEGEPLVMTIEVPEGATGNVTVYIDGKEYPAEIKDGVAVVTVDNLTAGNKTFVVEYSGDDNFTGNYTIGNLTVKEGKAESEVTVVDQGNGTITVVVGDNATGNVTVKVGNNTYTAEVINGTAVITLDNETPGTHEIEVIYSGDDTHEGANATSTITVPKFETPISVDVTDTKVGDTTEIVVNVPEDATGNVTIEIDGVKYTTEIKDGKATFEIDNLTAGTKTVAVDYVGDNNYVGNHTTAKLTVSKVPSTVSATIEDSNVGDNVTVKITVPEDATGQVLVDIDGVGYYVNVTNGTGSVEIPRVPSGKYDVTVTYPGDDKYLSSSNKTSFNMNKLPSYVIPTAKDIAVGDTEKITFELPSDATGTITVTIDGEEFTIDLDTLGAIDSEGDKFTVAVADGKAVLTITDLPKGEYSVEVRYNGDDKYMPSTNSTKFTVSKTSTDMEITDEGDGTVKVVLPDDATGNVTIKVGNDTYTAEVINGTAIVNLTNTTPGTHEIEVVYSGDDKYASQKENSTVTVPKYNTPISVDVDDISAGDTAVITVTVPDDATGEVTIEINGKEYTAEIKDGKAVFEVSDLAAGDKTVAVKYAGDDNYVGNFTTGNFTVSKVDSTISATSKNIKVGKDEVITVTVPKDATGRVLVDIDGVGYYADIVNGMAKVIVPELPSGKYTAKVTYEGDDKYLPSTTTTKFTVTKNAAPISADGDEVKQGEDATVVVKVPSDATGTVTITVDGKKYTAQVENGKAVFVIPGLTKGDHDVTAVYSGDKKYDANDTITDIEVTYSDNPNPDPDPENGDQDVQNGGVDLSQHATGNPILMLLLILILIGSTQLRRFRK